MIKPWIAGLLTVIALLGAGYGLNNRLDCQDAKIEEITEMSWMMFVSANGGNISLIIDAYKQKREARIEACSGVLR